MALVTCSKGSPARCRHRQLRRVGRGPAPLSEVSGLQQLFKSMTGWEGQPEPERLLGWKLFWHPTRKPLDSEDYRGRLSTCPPTLSLYSNGQCLKSLNDFGSLRLGPCWVRPGLGPLGPSGFLELSVYLLSP